MVFLYWAYAGFYMGVERLIYGFRECGSAHLALVTKNHILSAVQAPVGANVIFCEVPPVSAPFALTGAHKCPIEKSPQELLPQQHLPPPLLRPRFHRSGAPGTAELM